MKEKLYNLMNWAEIEGIVYSEEDRPGRILGTKTAGNAVLFQTFFPDAKKVTLVLEEKQKRVAMDMADEEGFFAALVTGKKAGRYHYEAEWKDGRRVIRKDPYGFEVSIPQEDVDRFHAGIHYEIYNILGSHKTQVDGCEGIQFSVWVPGAVRVSVIGEFNAWDGRSMPMNRVGDSGIFTLFVPQLSEDEEYLYEVKVKNGSVFTLQDPYAQESIRKEKPVSKLHKKEAFCWEDEAFRKAPKEKDLKVFSFNGKLSGKLNNLIKQIKEQGYEYVSLPSFYPGNSFYKLPDCFETEQQLKVFTNEMHKAGIGVLFTWNAADCQELYKKQISNFYIANVLYCMEEFHMDGLIFSEMEKLLYLDYGKESGQWTANAYGGNENLDGVEFIKHTNSILQSKKEEVILIADMDAIWPGVTKALHEEGLGFTYRFDTAFTKNVMEYLKEDPKARVFQAEKIMARMEYAFDERFMMAFTAEKTANFWKQIPGKEKDRFGTMKAFFAYITFLPGKVLAGFNVPEKEKKEYLALVTKCQKLKGEYEALKQENGEKPNFTWLNCGWEKDGIVSFMRNSEEEEGTLLVVANFTENQREEFLLGVPYEGKYELVFDTEETQYGGQKRKPLSPVFTEENNRDGYSQELRIPVSSFSVSAYRYTPFTEEEIYEIAEKRAEKIREQIMEEARRKAERLKKAKGKQ